MPLMAKSTQDRSEGVIRNYLIPTCGELCPRDLTALTVQRYFSNMASSRRQGLLEVTILRKSGIKLSLNRSSKKSA